jgi:hypothetical protein
LNFKALGVLLSEEIVASLYWIGLLLFTLLDFLVFGSFYFHRLDMILILSVLIHSLPGVTRLFGEPHYVIAYVLELLRLLTLQALIVLRAE